MAEKELEITSFGEIIARVASLLASRNLEVYSISKAKANASNISILEIKAECTCGKLECVGQIEETFYFIDPITDDENDSFSANRNN